MWELSFQLLLLHPAPSVLSVLGVLLLYTLAWSIAVNPTCPPLVWLTEWVLLGVFSDTHK